MVNKEKKEKFTLSKQGEIFLCIGVLSTIATLYTTEIVEERYIVKKYFETHDGYSVVIVHDGQLDRVDDASKSNYLINKDLNTSIDLNQDKGHNHINDTEYEVSYYDQNFLIIYTYNLDPDERKITTDYIISTIQVDENNYIIFDETALSKQGFNEYLSSVYQNNNQDVQRTRKES